MYTLFLILVIDNIELFCLFRKKNLSTSNYPRSSWHRQDFHRSGFGKRSTERRPAGTMDRLHCPIGSQSPKATWSRCYRRHLSRCLGFRPRSRRMQTQPSTLQPGHHRRIQPTRSQTPKTPCKTARCRGSRHSYRTLG